MKTRALRRQIALRMYDPKNPRIVPIKEALDRARTLSLDLVEVSPDNVGLFRALFGGLPCAEVGVVEADPSVRFFDRDGKAVLEAPIDELKAAWKRPLDW